MRCFIEIRKSELKTRLKELKIPCKHQDKVCDYIKTMIEDYLPFTVTEAVKLSRTIEGSKSLTEYIKKR